jgi:SNF2 family DNA or RNA helicase
LQAKKLDIADKILTGAKKIAASSKLTIEDLKELFNMAI